MSDVKKVVILGGGVGGVVTARTLRKKLPEPHRVVIVDRQRDHLFAPSLLWLMTGQRTADKIHRPLEQLTKKGIEVIRGDVDRIEPEVRRIHLAPTTRQGDADSGRYLDADHLVLSPGADLAPQTVPGLAEAGHNFYTLDGAENLRRALDEFDGGRIVVLTATPAYKCPAAPYEAAMLINDLCRKRGISDRTRIDLYTAEPGPMGVTGPELSASVRRMVEDQGVTYHPEHRVASVDSEARVISFDNDSTASFTLLAYVPPHHAPQVVRNADMVDETGWIPVDPNTLETRFPGVYAIGDVTGITLAMGKPLPMAGVFAEREALVVAQNIARDINGRGKAARYDGFGECFIETGRGRAGFGRGNFYAEPVPRIKLHKPSRRWHVGKVLFEKNWFRRWL